MENNHETKNRDSAHPERDGATHDETATVPRPGKGSAGDDVSESDCPKRPTTATRARKDKGRRHARNHGVLSRNPLEALIRLGENPRELIKIEKMLRAELKPTGTFGKILFDRAWSSFLRCLLIARTEPRLFMPVDQDSDRMPELKEAELPTLVWSEAGPTNYGFSDDLMKHLETVLRYDAHYAREFYRAVGFLVAMQTVGLTGLLDCL
jgi:hypothetical protein